MSAYEASIIVGITFGNVKFYVGALHTLALRLLLQHADVHFFSSAALRCSRERSRMRRSYTTATKRSYRLRCPRVPFGTTFYIRLNVGEPDLK